MRRIPSLDGLRALALSMVCINHFINVYAGGNLSEVERSLAIGNLGVRIFFVLSGFLISSLLLRELQATGKIDLLRFYYRRTLRIFPAYYFFLMTVIIVGLLGWWHYDRLLNAITYTSDYWEPGWTLGHSWSLAIEEQFYLLWPLLLVVVGRRRSLHLAFLCLLLCPLVRVALYLVAYRQDSNLLIHQFQSNADALATGCLFAGIRPWLVTQVRYQRLLDSRWFVCTPLIVLCAQEVFVHSPFRYATALSFLLGFTLMNVCTALCLDWCMTRPDSTVGRVLNLRMVVWLGSMSYSIYLWQEVILLPSDDRFGAPPWRTVIIGICGIFISYYLVERFFLSLRARSQLVGGNADHSPVTGPVA